MKALQVMGLLAFVAVNASAVNPEIWGPVEVKAVMPKLTEALDKKLAKKVASLSEKVTETGEIEKVEVKVTSLESYEVTLPSTKNSLKGVMQVKLSVAGVE